MPLMGNVYIGTSGLQTSQNALNTVAHNLSNSGTVGYTRQQVLLADKRYNTISKNPDKISNMQTGLGVDYARVRQVRDYFLDKTYRKEIGRTAFYGESYSTIEEVENLLGELEGAAFQTSLDDFWQSVQELAKDPSSSVTQGLFIQRASQFVERASSVYDGLSTYQDNLNVKIQDSVNIINKMGKDLYSLNNQIVAIEVGGTEKANDLRDQRNLILDELGKYTNMSYSEDVFGGVSVLIEGHPFVKNESVSEIAININSDNGFYTPYWKIDAKVIEGTNKLDISNAKVFDLTRTIATMNDTDVGELKAQLLARGDKRANYTDLDAAGYDQEISSSIIMNIQAEFDHLIHSIATSVNKVISDSADQATGYLTDDAGNPIQVFQKIAGDGYDALGNYIAESALPGQESTLYTLTNLTINPKLMQNSSLLGFVKSDGTVDFETALKLQNVFSEKKYTLNPNITNQTNLIDFYASMVSQIANAGSVFKGVYESQTTTVEATESARQQVVGVSDDEELSNMIKYQNAYNASSRYINVIDELLEHIINTLGV